MSNVGCAGILVADTFCGPLDALPTPGQLLAIDGLPVSVGGCAANVGIGLARQGVAVDVVGCLGEDSSAQVVRAGLTAAGVGCDHLVTTLLPTSQTIVLLVKGQDRRFLHLFGANAALAVEHFDREWLRSLSVFYLGGLYVLPGIDFAALADCFQFCQAHGIRTVLDVVVPEQMHDFSGLRRVLPHVDLFLPNDDEAARITGQAAAADQLAALAGWGAQTVVVTQGERGVDAQRGADRWHLEPYHIETVDPSGGGDAFAAGLIAGLIEGADLPEALRHASALGASAARAIGTTTGVFTAAERRAFLASQSPALTHQRL